MCVGSALRCLSVECSGIRLFFLIFNVQQRAEAMHQSDSSPMGFTRTKEKNRTKLQGTQEEETRAASQWDVNIHTRSEASRQVGLKTD